MKFELEIKESDLVTFKELREAPNGYVATTLHGTEQEAYKALLSALEEVNADKTRNFNFLFWSAFDYGLLTKDESIVCLKFTESHFQHLVDTCTVNNKYYPIFKRLALSPLLSDESIETRNIQLNNLADRFINEIRECCNMTGLRSSVLMDIVDDEYLVSLFVEYNEINQLLKTATENRRYFVNRKSKIFNLFLENIS